MIIEHGVDYSVKYRDFAEAHSKTTENMRSRGYTVDGKKILCMEFLWYFFDIL